MKLYKAITRVGIAGLSDYVDWYEAETIAEAMKLWEADKAEFGLPENATVELIETVV